MVVRLGRVGLTKESIPITLLSVDAYEDFYPQGVSLTHSEQLEAVEFLARDHGDELHFAEEADLRRREAGRKGEGHEVRWCIAGEDATVSEKQRKVFSTRKFNITRSACWSW